MHEERNIGIEMMKAEQNSLISAHEQDFYGKLVDKKIRARQRKQRMKDLQAKAFAK